MKRYILTLFMSLLLSASLFALELTTPLDSYQDTAIEVVVESSCEAESSPQSVWDDLYTKITLDFPKISKKISCAKSHFSFFDVKKEIFRPPWLV